jgi:rhodanese-related sulfurtransferase
MNTPVPTLGVVEAADLVRAGATLIDVREPYEFDEIRAVGARSVPLNSVPEHLDEWTNHRFMDSSTGESLVNQTQSSPLYVICRSGARSHAACEWLISQGVNAVNIVGGTLAWVAAELPTENSETE